MVDSSLIHPQRYLRTRPFAKDAIQRYRRQAGLMRQPTSGLLQDLSMMVQRYYNDAIMKVPFERRPERPTALLTQEVSLAAHVGKYAAFGRNAYVLKGDLVRLLDGTDAGAVRLGDIRLPNTAFYLSFGNAYDASLPGPPNVIDGAYVSELPIGEEKLLEIVVTTRRLDSRSDISSRWPFSRDLYYYVPFKDVTTGTTFAEALDAVIGTEVRIDTTALEAEPDFVGMLPDGRQAVVSDVSPLTASEQAAFAKEGLPAFRRTLALIANALCYMTAEPDDVVLDFPEDAPLELVAVISSGKPAAQDRAKATLLDRGYSQLRFVGSRVVPASGSGDGTSGSVRSHWRRGHWRRQPVGSGLSEVRLTWIRPTIVRADLGEPTVGHVYDVRPSSKDP